MVSILVVFLLLSAYYLLYLIIQRFGKPIFCDFCFLFDMCFLISSVASTHDQYVFSFYPDNRSCHGFEEVLARYRKIVPHLKLAGSSILIIHAIFFCLILTAQNVN